MNWLLNMSTGRKLAVVFGMCLFLKVCIGTFALTRMQSLNAVTGDIVSDPLAGLDALDHMSSSAAGLRMAQYADMATTSGVKDAALERQMTRDGEQFENAVNSYSASVRTDQERTELASITSAWREYLALGLKLHRLRGSADGGRAAEALLDGDMQRQYALLQGDMASDVKVEENRANSYSDAANHTYSIALWLVIGATLFAVGVGGFWAAMVSRHIEASLGELSRRLDRLRSVVTDFGTALRALESGDLTIEIAADVEPMAVRTADDFGRMGATFNEMQVQVQSALGSFRKSQSALRAMVLGLQLSAAKVSGAAQSLSATAEQVGGSTDEIAASMNEVSRACEQSARGATEVARGSVGQTRALTEVADQLRHLTQSVTGVASDAHCAASAANEADQVARSGAEAVKQTVDGMIRIQHTVSQSAEVIRSLGEASAQIGAIVGAIEEIAEQTNLLALNAAIEAARAGDAGRGFAVVADEVRKLAERSRGATREIGALIGKVQSHTEAAVLSMQSGTHEVEAGTHLAEEAGRALMQIQEVVSDVSGQVSRICAASEQILASSQHVSESISEVAAIAEESSSAAEEMSASAEEVSASVQSVAATMSQRISLVDELVSASVDLSGVAQDVDRTASQFKVRASGAEQTERVLRMAA